MKVGCLVYVQNKNIQLTLCFPKLSVCVSKILIKKEMFSFLGKNVDGQHWKHPGVSCLHEQICVFYTHTFAVGK